MKLSDQSKIEITAALTAELRQTFQVNDRLLRLALNQADALAWQTPYPHLVFPTLAMEKAQAVAAWRARQQRIHQMTSALSLAA